MRTRGQENVSFSENFAYVLNGWPLMQKIQFVRYSFKMWLRIKILLRLYNFVMKNVTRSWNMLEFQYNFCILVKLTFRPRIPENGPRNVGLKYHFYQNLRAFRYFDMFTLIVAHEKSIKN